MVAAPSVVVVTRLAGWTGRLSPVVGWGLVQVQVPLLLLLRCKRVVLLIAQLFPSHLVRGGCGAVGHHSVAAPSNHPAVPVGLILVPCNT